MKFEKDFTLDDIRAKTESEKKVPFFSGEKSDKEKLNALKWDQEKNNSEYEAQKLLKDIDGPSKKEKAREITEQWDKLDPKILDQLLVNVSPEKRKIVDAAKKYLWMNEKESPQQVEKFHTSAGANWCWAETAWCMSFVQHVLKEIWNPNYRPTSWAQDGLNMGTPTDNPEPWDLLIVKRWGGGHIGFFLGFAPSGKPVIIGGNQGQNWEVSIKEETRQILGYRSIA